MSKTGITSMTMTGWGATYQAGTDHSMEGKTIDGYIVDGKPFLFRDNDRILVQSGHDLKVDFRQTAGKELRNQRRRKAVPVR